MASKVQDMSNLTTKLKNFVSMCFVSITFVSYCVRIIGNSWHFITKIVPAAKMNKNCMFYLTLTVKMYNMLKIRSTFRLKNAFVTSTHKNLICMFSKKIKHYKKLEWKIKTNFLKHSFRIS